MANLCDLSASASGIVESLTADGVFRERLQGMGILPGRQVIVIRDGAPMVVDICGGRIALDRALAAGVHLVDVIEPGSDTQAAEAAE